MQQTSEKKENFALRSSKVCICWKKMKICLMRASIFTFSTTIFTVYSVSEVQCLNRYWPLCLARDMLEEADSIKKEHIKCLSLQFLVSVQFYINLVILKAIFVVFFSSSTQPFNWLPIELFQLTGTHSIIFLLNFCAVKVQSLQLRLCFSMMNMSGGALTSPAQSIFTF